MPNEKCQMIVLHGDHNVASRQALLDAKSDAIKKHQNILEFSGSLLTLSDLSSKAESTSLLGETNLLIITDFFIRRASKDKTSIISYLTTHSSLPLVFWEGKDVTLQLTNIPPNLVRKYDLPKYVFKFLDTFSPELLIQTLENTAPEQILALLSRRVRDLILAKYKVLTGPEWKTRQILSQSEKYDLNKLQFIYKKLLEIDYAQKTSASPYNLAVALELWVVNALR